MYKIDEILQKSLENGGKIYEDRVNGKPIKNKWKNTKRRAIKYVKEVVARLEKKKEIESK